MPEKNRSIVSYLILPMTVLFLFLSASVAFFSYRSIRSLIYGEYEKRLESTTQVLLAALPKEEELLRSRAPDVTRTLGQEQQIRLTFIDPEGMVFADTHEDPGVMENHAHRAEIRQAFQGEAAFSIRRSPTLDQMMLYYGSPIRDGSGSIIAVLRSSIRTESIETVLEMAGLSLSILTFFVLSLSVGAMILVSRKITIPLARIAREAERYAAFDFSSPIRADGPQEIVTTADALQKMAGALTKRIGQVSRQKQELEAVLSGMNEAVIVLDRNLVITELNSAAARLIEFSPDPPLGKSLIQVIRNTELNSFAQSTLRTGGVSRCSLVIRREGGETHLQVNASTIEALIEGLHGQQKIQRLVLVLNDITTLKRLEQIRKEFVANVSHELKTPITSIKGFVETLLDGAMEEPETARRFLSIVQNQTSRLGNIIEDLLTLSRLEQSEESRELNFETISLIHTVSEAISICQARGAEKFIDISMECPRELRVLGNSRLIEQALVNLIDNAIKYCPDESVVLVRAEKEPDGRIVLSVEDNGPGIPRADQARIFERFYRVEKARSRDMGGTGLGLAIVKHIMLTHGGSVELQSVPEEGSAFLLRFPAPPDPLT